MHIQQNGNEIMIVPHKTRSLGDKTMQEEPSPSICGLHLPGQEMKSTETRGRGKQHLTISLSSYTNNWHHGDEDASQLGAQCKHEDDGAQNLKRIPQEHGDISLCGQW